MFIRTTSAVCASSAPGRAASQAETATVTSDGRSPRVPGVLAAALQRASLTVLPAATRCLTPPE
jgi:hypothetical protein